MFVAIGGTVAIRFARNPRNFRQYDNRKHASGGRIVENHAYVGIDLMAEPRRDLYQIKWQNQGVICSSTVDAAGGIDCPCGGVLPEELPNV